MTIKKHRPEASPDDLDALQRRIRLVALLHVAENAGLTPVPILLVHTLAYLSNVLAPVWDMPPLDGKLLKRRGGPFYPAMQRDLDRLVGMGVAIISRLGYLPDEDGRWRLEGEYSLNRVLAEPILEAVSQFELERRLVSFLQELAYAFSAMGQEDLNKAITEDATYSDPIIDIGNVVDFAEWRKLNYSANAARTFEELLPGGTHASPGEMLHFYVRHLQKRVHGQR